MLRAFLSVCLWTTCAATAGAMVTAPADFDQMLAESQLVVHGRVVETQAYETAGRRTIETRVSIQVIDPLKGDVGDRVFFRVPGGQVGRYRRIMVGVPVFRPGDEVVVFLRGQMPALPMPFGITQGVYRVTRAADGRAVVTPPVTLTEGRIQRGVAGRRPADLASFVALVRSRTGERP